MSICGNCGEEWQETPKTLGRMVCPTCFKYCNVNYKALPFRQKRAK